MHNNINPVLVSDPALISAESGHSWPADRPGPVAR